MDFLHIKFVYYVFKFVFWGKNIYFYSVKMRHHI